jgi:hypothetical protein
MSIDFYYIIIKKNIKLNKVHDPGRGGTRVDPIYLCLDIF